jgi:hypothetical protein
MRRIKQLPGAIGSLLFATWTLSAAAQEPAAAPPPTTTTTTTTTPAPAPLPPPTPMTVPGTVATEPVANQTVVNVGTEEKRLPNQSLLVTGTVVLGLSYGGSALWAGISDREWDDKMFYPVAGPWLALDERDCNAERCGNKTLDTTLIIGSGVLQGIGALSMVMSLFIPESTVSNWFLIGDEDFSVTPVAGAAEVGATAIGRF